MNSASGSGGGSGGKGYGMGKGMGRGRGGGMGRGQSMGHGRGDGRGMERGQGFLPMDGSSSPLSKLQNLLQKARTYKAHAQDVMNQLKAVTKKTAGVEMTRVEATRTDLPGSAKQPSKVVSVDEKRFQQMTASIDLKRCASCGWCVDMCPSRAISMNDTVTIDPSKCSGCGLCVNECPNQAISLCSGQYQNAIGNV